MVKDLVIRFLKEKQLQLMEQYAEAEEICDLEEMQRCYKICEKIRREIEELEGENL